MTKDHIDAREWFDLHRDYTPLSTEGGGQVIPLYGLRANVTLGDDNLPRYSWQWDNHDNINRFEMVGMLTALINEILHGHVIDAVEDLKARVAEAGRGGSTGGRGGNGGHDNSGGGW